MLSPKTIHGNTNRAFIIYAKLKLKSNRKEYSEKIKIKNKIEEQSVVERKWSELKGKRNRNNEASNRKWNIYIVYESLVNEFVMEFNFSFCFHCLTFIWYIGAFIVASTLRFFSSSSNNDMYIECSIVMYLLRSIYWIELWCAARSTDSVLVDAFVPYKR